MSPRGPSRSPTRSEGHRPRPRNRTTPVRPGVPTPETKETGFEVPLLSEVSSVVPVLYP